MSNRTIKRLFGGIGTLLILLIAIVIIAAYFLTDRNLQRINVQEYTEAESDGQGGYTFSLNVDRMLFSEHLIVPPESELAQYPEIAALKTLGVRATEQDGGYKLETISTSTDAKFNETLKKGGIKLVGTQWTWTKEQVAAMLQAKRTELKHLRYSDYVRTKRDADGSFSAAVDLVQLMHDAKISETADPETDVGARAIRSLGIDCSKQADGYLLQATSVIGTVIDDLATAGLKINGTSWTWTEAEMEAHLGTVETLPPYQPQSTETPTPSETPAETDADESQMPSETPADTPEAHETPAPTAAPTDPGSASKAIETLYGFDQTEVRKAIRSAKEAKYGSKLESSEVRYNYFAVGSGSTEHRNVFRLVYVIKASNNTDYLIADVYDLTEETGYTASDVHLTVATSDRNARSTDDLAGYTVYTLEGGSMVFEENKDKNPYDADGLVMAKSLTEKVQYYELWNIPATKDKTLYQLLGYARNEMFARGGHKFKDTSNYYKYFRQYSWYKPTGEVTANELAAKYPATKDNIATIKFLENLIKNG